MRGSHESDNDYREPGRYEIRVKGHLDSRWSDRFEGLIFTYESNGTTRLCGPVVDQAALHGLLRNIRDLGLTLISVVWVNPERQDTAELNSDTDHSFDKKETSL
jgi:hypothetical protein